MKKLTRLRVAFAVGLFSCMVPQFAAADVIILDFNGPYDLNELGCPGISPFQCTNDYVEDGFRIQVLRGHYDIVPSYDGTGGGSPWMGFDTGFPATIRLDFFGEAFNILGLDVIVADFSILSSKGGFGANPGLPGPLDLTGSEWRSVTWVEFSADVGAPVGFDNVRLVPLPEPTTLALLGIGLFGLGLTRRREKV